VAAETRVSIAPLVPTWMGMHARHAILLALLATGCQRPLDLGRSPHLLGKLEDVDIHGTRADLFTTFPALERAARENDDVDDGDLRYRVWFDSDDPTRIESFIVFVARPLDDVVAAWGPGQPNQLGGLSYTDPARGIRYSVEAGDETHCIVRAQPMIPLSTLLGDAGDIRLLGLDLIDLPWGEVGTAFRSRALIPWKPPSGADLSDMLMKFQRTRDFSTEVATCHIDVDTRGSATAVMSFELTCFPDVSNGREKLLAAFDHKWGQPARGTIGAFELERWIYPEVRSPLGEAVRVSLDDGVALELHVDPLRTP
jgi:hypothetical protein